MIVEGEVSVTKQGQAGELARRGVSDYFGELSLKTVTRQSRHSNPRAIYEASTPPAAQATRHREC